MLEERGDLSESHHVGKYALVAIIGTQCLVIQLMRNDARNAIKKTPVDDSS